MTDLYQPGLSARSARDDRPEPKEPASPYAEVIPRREVIPQNPQHSVRVMTHDFPSEICGWNAHPEYEIHLITKTHGSFIAGDHIGTFGPGHVSIMGPNLPHDWVSDLEPGQVAVDRDAVIQFTDGWIRQCMRAAPRAAGHRRRAQALDAGPGLLRRHRRGGRRRRSCRSSPPAGPERVGHLFKLLGLMANAPDGEWETVASEWMGRPDDDGARSAGEAGLNYIFSNLTGDIRLTTAAQLAYMSEPSFSKYFKRATGLTFSNMVKKLRVAHARRLLDSTDHPITRVATLSGYHNMANFNRQFLAEVGMHPVGLPADGVVAEAAQRGAQPGAEGGPRRRAGVRGPVGGSAEQVVERRVHAPLDERAPRGEVLLQEGLVVGEVTEQHLDLDERLRARVGRRRGHLRRVHVIRHLRGHDLAAADQRPVLRPGRDHRGAEPDRAPGLEVRRGSRGG